MSLDDLPKELEIVTLTTEEEGVADIDASSFNQTSSKLSCCLVGKVLTHRQVPLLALTSGFNHSQMPTGSFEDLWFAATSMWPKDVLNFVALNDFREALEVDMQRNFILNNPQSDEGGLTRLEPDCIQVFTDVACKVGVQKSLMAELLAIREAVAVARTSGMPKLLVRSDCLEAISLPRKEKADDVGDHEVLRSEILGLGGNFKDLKFIYVKRELNNFAHKLAHWAFSFENNFISPNFLFNWVMACQSLLVSTVAPVTLFPSF